MCYRVEVAKYAAGGLLFYSLRTQVGIEAGDAIWQRTSTDSTALRRGRGGKSQRGISRAGSALATTPREIYLMQALKCVADTDGLAYTSSEGDTSSHTPYTSEV